MNLLAQPKLSTEQLELVCGGTAIQGACLLPIPMSTPKSGPVIPSVEKTDPPIVVEIEVTPIG